MTVFGDRHAPVSAFAMGEIRNQGNLAAAPSAPGAR
jgi:hypothetical protein